MRSFSPGLRTFSQVAVANGQVVITRPETNTVEIFNPVKRRVVARILGRSRDGLQAGSLARTPRRGAR